MNEITSAGKKDLSFEKEESAFTCSTPSKKKKESISLSYSLLDICDDTNNAAENEKFTQSDSFSFLNITEDEELNKEEEKSSGNSSFSIFY